MELQLPQINSLGAFFEGRTAGREVKRQKTLADYMPGAMTGDKDAISRIAGVDPDAAMKAQTHAGQLKGEAAQQLVQQAKWFTQAPESMKPQLYASLVKTAHAAGMDYIPETYDPQFAKGIEQLAGVGGGEQFTLSPGSKRFGPDGKVIAEVPFAPKGFDGAWDSERAMWIPRPGAMPAQGQSMPAPTTGGGAQVLDDALTNAVIQQESGGNPNAVSPAGARGLMQLMPGTQRDPGFGVQPAKDDSPQENVRVGRDYLQAMLSRYGGDQQLALAAYNAGPGRVDQALQAAGGDKQRAIASLPAETRNYVLSVQARVGGQQGGLAGIPVAGVSPKAKEDKPTELERKLELARRMGASDEQLKQMVMGDVGGGKPNATMLRQANAAKQKLIDLNAIEQQLARVEGAFKPLQNTFSATPYVGKFIPSEEGKRFDSTVSLLQGMVRKLTRTPGEGAMSDYETKLAQLANPSRSEYESVTGEQLAQLKELVATMRQGYQAILEDNGGSSANIQPKASTKAASDIDALLDKYK